MTGRLARRERLTGRADFQALFQRGKRIDRPVLILLWRVDETRRVGFAVSRQVRGAVKRNRVRRRLREAYREARGAAPQAAAFIVIGRPAVLRVSFRDLVGQLRDAFTAIPSPELA